MKSLLLVLAIAAPLLAQITSYPTSQVLNGQLQVNQPNGVPQLDANGYVPIGNTSYRYRDLTDPMLFAWQQSLANTNGGTLVMIGDSVTAGIGATPQSAGWAYLVQQSLQQKYGQRSSGIILANAGGSGYSSAAGTITYAGSWALYPGAGVYGAGGGGTQVYDIQQGTASGTAALTCNGCTSFNVYYLTYTDTASGFQAKIDSGSNTTYGATTSAGYTYAVQNITTGSAISHTLTVTAPVSGSMYLWGVEAVYGATGATVHNLGVSSSATANWSYNTALSLGGMALFQNQGSILSTVSLGINDCENAVPQSTFQANLQAIVIAAQNYGPVLIIDPHMVGAVSSCTATIQTNYKASRQAVAKATGAMYLSVSDRWGSDYATANGLGLINTTDHVHPTTAGHVDWANIILQRVDYMRASGQPTTGLHALQFGTASTPNGSGTTNVDYIGLGGTYSTVPCAAIKVRLFESTGGAVGPSVSNGSYDDCLPSTWPRRFYFGTSLIASIGNTVSTFGSTGGSGVGSTTPYLFDLGNTYSSVAFANPKLKIFNAGSITAGFGFSVANGFEYMVTTGYNHTFSIAGTTVGQFTAKGIVAAVQVPPTGADPGCTATGDIGRQWFDNTTTTTVFKVCMSVAGTVQWVTK